MPKRVSSRGYALDGPPGGARQSACRSTDTDRRPGLRGTFLDLRCAADTRAARASMSPMRKIAGAVMAVVEAT